MIPGNFRGMAYKERQDQKPAVLHTTCSDEMCACQKWWEKNMCETNAGADVEQKAQRG